MPTLKMSAYFLGLSGLAAILAMNAQLIKHILISGVTACGPDYGPKTGDDNVILFGYGILPSVAFLLLFLSTLKRLR